MKTFKIPVRWEVAGFVKVEAESLDEAIKYFDENSDHIPLPEGEYIDASFEREDEEMCQLNNEKDG